jgi:hypothetical protein
MGPAALLREIDTASLRLGTRSSNWRAAPAIRFAAAFLVTFAVAVSAVAATSWEPLRRQLALSFSREPARYVEVFLTSPPTATDLGGAVPTLGQTEGPAALWHAFPPDQRARRLQAWPGLQLIRVPVTIRSHSEALVRQPIALQIRERAGPVVTRRGVVSVPSDGIAHVLMTAAVPRAFGPWSAVVSMRGRPERLLLHGGALGTVGG